jgi:glycosyltransferase involved in cell wall biosynthesis
MNELVSIIMPSYNSAKYISEAIESVIAQTYTNWELVITDDCSTDNSRDIIKQYAETDSRVKLFCLNENSGAGVARNNSIKEAKGRFIAFLDSDDRWMPNKLEVQIKFMLDDNKKALYNKCIICIGVLFVI